MRHALLLTVLAVGLAAASPAAASPAVANDDAVSVPVTLTDLDLSKPADAARLRTRLSRAATTACAAPGTQGVHARQAFGACRSAALSKAELSAERAIAAASQTPGTAIRTARR